MMEPRESESHAGTSQRILLVEDHESTGEVLRRLLTRAGYQVSLADSLAAVHDLLQNERFDLLISDLRLGDGTGPEVLEAVRRFFEIPAIALSGSVEIAEMQSPDLAGFSKCLSKPADWELLHATVRKCLAESPGPNPS